MVLNIASLRRLAYTSCSRLRSISSTYVFDRDSEGVRDGEKDGGSDGGSEGGMDGGSDF